MHVLLGIIGVIAALSYYFFIFKRAGQAANSAIDMAEQLRGKMRRNAFRKKAEGSVLTSIEDPGTAAAVLLVKIAEEDGPLTDEIKGEILKIIGDEIGMNDADEIVPFAEWVSNQVINTSEVIRAYKGLWRDNLNEAQLHEFVDMAKRIADFNSPANAQQKEILRLMNERVL